MWESGFIVPWYLSSFSEEPDQPLPQAGQMNNVFTDLECFALLVGSICHDIDHRGTNNKFQEM